MSAGTGSHVQEEAAKNKAERQRRRRVNTADKEEEEPPRLAVTEHQAARAITATTLHLIPLPPPRGAAHYEPTCQQAACLFHVSLDAHGSRNSQLV